MKFLIDNNISYRICPHLEAAGHKAVHVDALALAEADDIEILQRARADAAVVLSADTDFGSPVLWRMSADGDYQDWDQHVLESEPYRRLSYTWHNYQPEMAEMFGWSDEQLAQLRKERRSKVTFEIEPVDSVVKLTVIHDDFEPDSEMLKGVSEGWPAILSYLKTLLETDEDFARPAGALQDV